METKERLHELKIWPHFYEEVIAKIKTYEVRVNDRAFKVGDFLLLREWDNEHNFYTGRSCQARIIHMTDSSHWYMIPNHLAILGIELLP
jgi:hypothetical protein